MADITAAQAQKYAKLLRDAFLFGGFSEEEIAQLLRTPGVCRMQYATGAELLHPHAGDRGLFVLLRGSAVVEKPVREGVLRVSELRPCALFGMAGLFGPEQYPTRIRAQKNAAALFIPEQAFRDMLRADFRLAENYIRYLTGRIHFLNARIGELTCSTAEQRVLQYLSQNAEHGVITITITALAQTLNVSRASLYRALDKLEAEGGIKRRGRIIEIIDGREE